MTALKAVQPTAQKKSCPAAIGSIGFWHVPGHTADAMTKGGVQVISNLTVLPVTAGPRAGVCAAALGAALPYAAPSARPRSTDHLPMAPARVTTGTRMPWQSQAAVKQPLSFGSAVSAQGTLSTTYIHANGAAANGGGQTGSLPAWDPV